MIHRLKCVLIVSIALHSIIVGAAMLMAPIRTLALFGWTHVGQTFFIEQSGVLLVILGFAYVLGLWHRSFACFLVASKGIAVMFLLAEYFSGSAPAMVLLTALIDGMMGTAVAVVLVLQSMKERP